MLEKFKNILNRPEPDLAFEGIEKQDELEINTNSPSKDEIAITIKSIKSGKAAGIDEIQAELLKAELTSAKNIMFKLFITIWTK